MTLSRWGRKVLLLAIIPVPQYPVKFGQNYKVKLESGKPIDALSL